MTGWLAPLLLSGLLAGCYSVRYAADSRASPGEGRQGASVSIARGDRVVTGIIVTLLLAEGARSYIRGEDGTLSPLEDMPDLHPGRAVNEQDCTQPVDPALGNLRCR